MIRIRIDAAAVLTLLAAGLVLLVLLRLLLNLKSGKNRKSGGTYGTAQTRGSREVQADLAEVVKNSAGMLGILTDGIGACNTGLISAQIALDTAADAFEPYHVLTNPEYFFRTVFYEANIRIQQTIGERRGGCCMALAFIGGGFLHYALAGDIRIALFRNKEIIPLSQGHTIDVLAKQAYEAGKLTKKEAVWSMEEKRRWNHLGMDGFREIELPDSPVRLKKGDIVVLTTRGIWEEVSWAELEDMLCGRENLAQKARQIVWTANRKPGSDKENGSVLLLEAEVTDETN